MSGGRAMARRGRGDDQRRVVVRIDAVVYVLVAVIAVLALASACWPGRIELSLITTISTLLTGILTGWLAYMRLSARGRDDGAGEDEEGGG